MHQVLVAQPPFAVTRPNSAPDALMLHSALSYKAQSGQTSTLYRRPHPHVCVSLCMCVHISIAWSHKPTVLRAAPCHALCTAGYEGFSCYLRAWGGTAPAASEASGSLWGLFRDAREGVWRPCRMAAWLVCACLRDLITQPRVERQSQNLGHTMCSSHPSWTSWCVMQAPGLGLTPGPAHTSWMMHPEEEPDLVCGAYSCSLFEGYSDSDSRTDLPAGGSVGVGDDNPKVCARRGLPVPAALRAVPGAFRDVAQVHAVGVIGLIAPCAHSMSSGGC